MATRWRHHVVVVLSLSCRCLVVVLSLSSQCLVSAVACHHCLVVVVLSLSCHCLVVLSLSYCCLRCLVSAVIFSQLSSCRSCRLVVAVLILSSQSSCRRCRHLVDFNRQAVHLLNGIAKDLMKVELDRKGREIYFLASLLVVSVEG